MEAGRQREACLCLAKHQTQVKHLDLIQFYLTILEKKFRIVIFLGKKIDRVQTLSVVAVCKLLQLQERMENLILVVQQEKLAQDVEVEVEGRVKEPLVWLAT